MKKIALILIFISNTLLLFAQTGQPTDPNSRLASFEERKQLQLNSIASEIPIKNIGPTVFSGRVTDLDVNPEDPSEFYVSYASGGLWHTHNNGTTFKPIFDDNAVMTIGDIAVDWSTGTIWVGTGEVNSSRSSYAGLGIYKSSDQGKTWEHKGLSDSHHIGRVLLHPTDKNTLWVAVLGHLYSANEERGVFKTTDGGMTWTKSLYVDDNTGAVDMIIDPDNPDILYAAMWERSRKAWNFQESGPGSGIYKSTDGGNTWSNIASHGSGFPHGDGTGRIGLTLSKKDGKTYLYAFLDNYFRRPEKPKEDDAELTKNDFKAMSKEAFLKLDDEDLGSFLKDNGFPKKYKAKGVKKMVEADKILPSALADYMESANSLLFDTPVIGAEVYVSTDDGQQWKKTHADYIERLYNSYGYYFGQIRSDPNNPMKLYIMGVPILRSDDGGVSWVNVNGENVHVDHHALWINPEKPEHIINGNDGGVNISYDEGENWIKCNMPAVAQFYYVNVDMAEPYNVYGGTQDNGVWVGSHNYQEGVRWQNRGKYPYESLMGGDGMQVQIDTRDNNTVYTGFQFGNYFRINKRSGKRTYITPKHELGDRPYRWNWQAPILLSSHNQDILYMGSNKLHRSMDQGASWTALSGDLTQGGKKGDVPFGTLATIDESVHKFGLIYTGSDDGIIHRTMDGGSSWTDISKDLPSDLWVSRVQASLHDEGTVYASLNGYRSDDFKPYLYKSTDYGDTWTDISGSLPLEPINVIKEDPVDGDILYVGTDHGVYISLNGGEQFMRIAANMPHVSVHDVVIHPKAHDLIIGTHGRSLYKINIEALRTVNKTKENLIVFEPSEQRYSERFGTQPTIYRDVVEPEIKILVFAKEAGDLTMKISTSKGKVLTSKKYTVPVGISEITYDLSIDNARKKELEKYINTDKEKKDKIKIEAADNGKIYLRAGAYGIAISRGNHKSETTLKIK